MAASAGAASDPTLAVADPEIHEILEKEQARQFRGLELIASENFTSRAVMEALGYVDAPCVFVRGCLIASV
jgi:glycine/serine hydroxymethyltransferase